MIKEQQALGKHITEQHEKVKFTHKSTKNVKVSVIYLRHMKQGFSPGKWTVNALPLQLKISELNTVICR